MLIKGIEKGGKAIPIAPKDAIPYAVQYGVKSKNTPETIFWVDPKKVTVSSFHHNVVDVDGNWVAQVSGQAMIGKTDVATDMFHVEKLCNYKMKYKSGKDAVGIPDIIVDSFEFSQVETNPAKMVGYVETAQAPALAMGELQAQSEPTGGGKPSKKMAKT